MLARSCDWKASRQAARHSVGVQPTRRHCWQTHCTAPSAETGRRCSTCSSRSSPSFASIRLSRCACARGWTRRFEGDLGRAHFCSSSDLTTRYALLDAPDYRACTRCCEAARHTGTTTGAIPGKGPGRLGAAQCPRSSAFPRPGTSTSSGCVVCFIHAVPAMSGHGHAELRADQNPTSRGGRYLLCFASATLDEKSGTCTVEQHE